MATDALQGWGEVSELEERRGDREHGIESRFEFRPAEPLRDKLPQDFAIRFAVVRPADGVRRIVPADGFEAFLLQAGLLGQAILQQSGTFDDARVETGHVLRLVFQYRNRIRESFNRSFTQFTDLVVAKSGRRVAGEANVLPDRLGSENSAGQRAWTTGELLKRGDEEARTRGIKSPSIQTRIRLGLLRAALNAPMMVDGWSDKERVFESRFVLFNTDHELVPAGIAADADEHFDRVRERFMAALESHLDDTTDEFNRWFFEKADGVIHQISKQVSDGGPIPRNIVREVRLKTILEAYQSMAVCMHAAMRAVWNSLPIDKLDAETDHFELLYRRQEALAGLPLVLLRDRLARIGIDPLVCPVEDADPGVLLRLLHYYAEMISKRRAADRQLKSRGTATESPLKFTRRSRKRYPKRAQQSHGPPRSSPLVVPPPARVEEGIEDLAHQIVNHLDLNCGCSGTGAYQIEVAEETEDEVPDQLSLGCGVCGWEQTVQLTAELLSEIRSRSDDQQSSRAARGNP